MWLWGGGGGTAAAGKASAGAAAAAAPSAAAPPVVSSAVVAILAPNFSNFKRAAACLNQGRARGPGRSLGVERDHARPVSPPERSGRAAEGARAGGASAVLGGEESSSAKEPMMCALSCSLQAGRSRRAWALGNGPHAGRARQEGRCARALTRSPVGRPREAPGGAFFSARRGHRFFWFFESDSLSKSSVRVWARARATARGGSSG